jgi:hypothetical protein
MRRTLPEARDTLIAAMKRDTPGTDLPRFVVVLDALIEWSLARPELLTFRSDETTGDALRFERVGTKALVWSARVTRGSGPKLEIDRGAGESLTDADRAAAIETLNAHARAVLMEGDRLQISFGAIKNVVARTAVLELLDRLLVCDRQVVER